MNLFELCDLLLKAPCLVIQNLLIENHQLRLSVESNQYQASCPTCAVSSHAQHSTYWRYPQDLPWATMPVVLELKVKRFFCTNIDCKKKTFAERFPDVVGWYARRTQRVVAKQQRLSLSSTARMTEMLLHEEHIPLSDTSVNRLVRRLPDPEQPPVRVLGVDDWAKRKGQRYGTILIDLERSQVIDILEDRTADTLANWLEKQPAIEMVSRDRSQTYADAIDRAAPDAIQIADRFHLLRNLSDTVYHILQQEEKAIRKHFTRVILPVDLPEQKSVETIRALTSSEIRRQERMTQVEHLRQLGWSQKDIARQLNVNPKTAHRYRDRSSPMVHRTARGSKLNAFKPYLLDHWNAGCHNARQLYNEIRGRGYRGEVTLVRDFVRTLRTASGLPPKAKRINQQQIAKDHIDPSPPTLRTLAWWILKRPEDRTEAAEIALAQLSNAHPVLLDTIALARTFSEMVREQQVDRLASWLEQVEVSNHRTWKRFAAGLKQDLSAVSNALTFLFSNGPTEGHVNRLKCIKRMMYGRANDDLLRKRVFWQGKFAFT